MISKRSVFLLILILMPLVLTACSDTSSALGKYHEGRILILNVMEMKRSDELRYSTIDTEDVVRRWRIQPSKEGQELLLMRFRIDNHVAMNTVVVADQHAAILEGFFQDDFQPISVSGTVFLDKRGQGDATVTLDGVDCMDHARVVVSVGTSVQWINSGDTESSIQFLPGVTTGLGNDLLQLAPGGMVSTRFDQPGTFGYQCSGENGDLQQAQILAEEAISVRKQREDNILFLEGSFNLPKDTSIDGWMIFDIPEGTEIRTLRWRAGDSITVRF